jgi:hypothetical protein
MQFLMKQQRLVVRPPPWAVQPLPGVTLWHGHARRLLLWWSRPSLSSRRRRVPTCMPCYNAVRTLSTDTRHMVATLRCSGRWWWRTVSPHHRLAGTSNLLVHDDVRATKTVGSPRGWRSRRQQKTWRIKKKLSSDYHVGRICCI